MIGHAPSPIWEIAPNFPIPDAVIAMCTRQWDPPWTEVQDCPLPVIGNTMSQ